MASTLAGLFRSLDWKNFRTKKAAQPAAGQTGNAAHTACNVTTNGWSSTPVPRTKPIEYTLLDNLAVRINFFGAQSFVNSWVFSQPQQFQDDMLSHEQGHYDLTALIGRDFFVDVMQLKLQTYSSPGDLMTAVSDIKSDTLDKIQAVQDLYDDDVHPEQDAGQSRGPKQQAWDRYVQTALSTSRGTAEKGLDGTPLRMRLIDVLSGAGKSV